MIAKNKRNHLLRLQRFFAGNVRIWRWETEFDEREKDDVAHVTLEVRKSPMLKNYQKKHNSLIPQMVSYPMDWMLCCRALCSNGTDEWLETEMVRFRNMALTTFSNAYFDMREKVLDAVQKRQVIDVGWIAHTAHPRLSLDGEWYMHAMGEVNAQRKMLWNYSEALVKRRMMEVAA